MRNFGTFFLRDIVHWLERALFIYINSSFGKSRISIVFSVMSCPQLNLH